MTEPTPTNPSVDAVVARLREAIDAVNRPEPEHDSIRTLGYLMADHGGAILDRLELLEAGCPFDRKGCRLKPEDPCPVCGAAGTDDSPDRCITSSSRTPLMAAREGGGAEAMREAAAQVADRLAFAAQERRDCLNPGYERCTEIGRVLAALGIADTIRALPAPAQAERAVPALPSVEKIERVLETKILIVERRNAVPNRFGECPAYHEIEGIPEAATAILQLLAARPGRGGWLPIESAPAAAVGQDVIWVTGGRYERPSLVLPDGDWWRSPDNSKPPTHWALCQPPPPPVRTGLGRDGDGN